MDLVVTHLNASIGPVLTAGQLAAAMRVGSLAAIDDPRAAAAAAYMFVEARSLLIVACARYTGASLAQVNRLYEETLADHLPRVPEWEELFLAGSM